MRSLKDIQNLFQAIGIPGRDAYDLPSSDKTFPDGGHYRMEISGVERPNVLEAVIDEMDKRKIDLHRMISVVMGSTLLDDAELRDFAQMAADAGLEVIMTPGPRSGWDVGRQLVTPGGLSGLRFRGSDQLSFVVAEIMRCIDLGFRGFLVIDEGLLCCSTRLKRRGYIPQDVIFKVSIFAGTSAAGGHGCRCWARAFQPAGRPVLRGTSIRRGRHRSTCTFTCRTRSGASTASTRRRNGARVLAVLLQDRAGSGAGVRQGAMYKPGQP